MIAETSVQREMYYSKELYSIGKGIPTCNFTITPGSVDEYLSLGRMIVSLITGNLVQASSTIMHTDIGVLPLLSSLIAVNSHYLAILDPDVADLMPLLTPVTEIWAYNAALSFAEYGSCKNNPSLPILGRLQTAPDNADASFLQFSWNAASQPFLLEKGKQLFIAWVHQFNPPLYTALNVTGEGVGRARVPQFMKGSFVMAGITTEMVEDLDALSLATLAGPVVLNL
ncbi:hypothetical protein SLS60_011924 [Paraconiothyrium brasiliense]|uniref:Protein kinase domain-containing protein n=1 Tax=Paraconiothyrium brasiliense TaxID=300254 RepID=A0ABR3QHA0_9PLEO